MVLEITSQGVAAFGFAVGVFLLFSYMDLKERKVQNRIVVAAFIIGLSLSLISGHFLDHLYLHLAAICISLLTIPLFYIGTIGGADLKIIVLLQFVSPGYEFGHYGDFLYEATLGVLFPLIVMFVLGILYSEKKADSKPTPLIPFLFVGYLLVQLLVFL